MRNKLFDLMRRNVRNITYSFPDTLTSRAHFKQEPLPKRHFYNEPIEPTFTKTLFPENPNIFEVRVKLFDSEFKFETRWVKPITISLEYCKSKEKFKIKLNHFADRHQLKQQMLLKLLPVEEGNGELFVDNQHNQEFAEFMEGFVRLYEGDYKGVSKFITSFAQPSCSIDTPNL